MLVRNTTRDSISSGRCAPPSVGRPNWATNWYQCPTPGTRTTYAPPGAPIAA